MKKIKNWALIALIIVTVLNTVNVLKPEFFKIERIQILNLKWLEAILFCIFYWYLWWDYFEKFADVFITKWFLPFLFSGLGYIFTLIWLGNGFYLICHISILIFFISSNFKVERKEEVYGEEYKEDGAN